MRFFDQVRETREPHHGTHCSNGGRFSEQLPAVQRAREGGRDAAAGGAGGAAAVGGSGADAFLREPLDGGAGVSGADAFLL